MKNAALWAVQCLFFCTVLPCRAMAPGSQLDLISSGGKTESILFLVRLDAQRGANAFRCHHRCRCLHYSVELVFRQIQPLMLDRRYSETASKQFFDKLFACYRVISGLMDDRRVPRKVGTYSTVYFGSISLSWLIVNRHRTGLADPAHPSMKNISR